MYIANYKISNSNKCKALLAQLDKAIAYGAIDSRFKSWAVRFFFQKNAIMNKHYFHIGVMLLFTQQDEHADVQDDVQCIFP